MFLVPPKCVLNDFTYKIQIEFASEVGHELFAYEQTDLKQWKIENNTGSCAKIHHDLAVACHDCLTVDVPHFVLLGRHFPCA